MYNKCMPFIETELSLKQLFFDELHKVSAQLERELNLFNTLTDQIDEAKRDFDKWKKNNPEIVKKARKFNDHTFTKILLSQEDRSYNNAKNTLLYLAGHVSYGTDAKYFDPSFVEAAANNAKSENHLEKIQSLQANDPLNDATPQEIEECKAANDKICTMCHEMDEKVIRTRKAARAALLDVKCTADIYYTLTNNFIGTFSSPAYAWYRGPEACLDKSTKDALQRAMLRIRSNIRELKIKI